MMFGKFDTDSKVLLKSGFSMILAVVLLFVLGSGMAHAMQWCGENGVIRFSFVENELGTNINHVASENGVTKVTLVAWLTDVDPVSIDGNLFDTVGGFELDLNISGAQGFITNKKIMGKGLNVAKSKGGFVAGLAFGLPLVENKVPLAQWEILFQGEVKNVKFSLDPESLHSCRTCPGCPEGTPLAIYIGAGDSSQAINLFGAGYIPAWLNPGANPDVTLVSGKSTWQDVGRYQTAEK